MLCRVNVEESSVNKAAAFSEQEAPYAAVFGDVSKSIGAARESSARPVTAAMASAYWLTGHRIVEFEQSEGQRAGSGAALIERLAADPTRRFGRGFTRRNVRPMRLFYRSYSPDHIRQRLPGRFDADSVGLRIADSPLPSSAYVRLLSVGNERGRAFCESEALRRVSAAGSAL